MSKLIVEMEMPENCFECYFSTACSFCEGYDDVCVLAPKDAEYKWNFSDGIKPSERPSWCPIKGVLPDEHGDLIDRDKFVDKYIRHYTEQERKMNLVFAAVEVKQDFSDMIYEEDAVIEAERKDDGK